MPKGSKESCFQSLRQRILTTDLAPGADLDEATLSATYDISRTPLREVLQRLSGRGYARIETNRGAKVASMDIGVMRTFFQTAPMIYAHIARLAAENRKPDELDDLKSDQQDFAAAVANGDVTRAALSNHRFHGTIGRMAHNPYLTACLDRLLIDHTRLSQTFYRPTEPRDSAAIQMAVEQHDAMIVAIEDRAPERALELTHAHWDLSRDRMDRFVRPDPLPVDPIHSEEGADAV
ncbi:MAG: GntR family transcriptional regulator [Pseudomonadota bacterium]